jgi:hypothetical protein
MPETTMQLRRGFAAALATAAVLAAGCDRSPTGGPDALTAEEARAVAEAYSQLGTGEAASLGGPAASMDAERIGGTNTFSFTGDCPRGGVVRLDGSSTLTPGEAPSTATFAVTATRTEEACGIPLRNGVGTLTLDGNPNVQFTSHSIWTDWIPGDLTATQKGSFRWTRSTGGSGVCTVDITTVVSRAAMTYTVAGSFCGHEFSVSGSIEP